MEPLGPLYTADLFPPLHQELLTLLRSLSPADWARPTVAREWQVRDVVSHLLDGDLRKLSGVRDHHAVEPPEPIETCGDLVRYLNSLNAEWVAAARRLSPRMLVELHAVTGPMVAELMAALPPHAPARFAVSIRCRFATPSAHRCCWSAAGCIRCSTCPCARCRKRTAR